MYMMRSRCKVPVQATRMMPSMSYRFFRTAGPLLLAAALAGCEAMLPSFYSPPLRQGNYLDQALVDQLRPGMSRQEVQRLLGTPLVADPFHQNRWDYYYRYRQDGKPIEQRHIALFFTGDTLDRVEAGRP